MSELLTPAGALKADSPLILTAILAPVAGHDRFQPAGFPEVGHVIYKAPRGRDGAENVCIVDSPASMANHLESVCMRSAHDLDLVDELTGMPYIRCVTGALEDDKLKTKELVVTSVTEGHRIASTYFLGEVNDRTKKWDRKGGQRVLEDGSISDKSFGDELASDFGIVPREDVYGGRGHPSPEKWWDVFKTIFKYDPNALVHGVLFPQWQIKISRVLTAHLEAFGASRVDRSGVKFDRLGKTTSGQPIFAVDDSTAREIRATFVLDLALLRSFGRQDGESTRGLSKEQKSFLIALALWKINELIKKPFRYRSGCYLKCSQLVLGRIQADDQCSPKSKDDLKIEVDIQKAICSAAFRNQSDRKLITDVYWPVTEIYSKPPSGRSAGSFSAEDDVEDGSSDGSEDE